MNHTEGEGGATALVDGRESLSRYSLLAGMSSGASASFSGYIAGMRPHGYLMQGWMFPDQKQKQRIGTNGAAENGLSAKLNRIARYRPYRVPSSLVFLPVGVIGGSLWQTFVADPVRKQTLVCPACAMTRGMCIGICFGVLPSVAFSNLPRKRSHISVFMKKQLSDVLMVRVLGARPIGMYSAVCMGLGFYWMASREFWETYNLS
eukprot:Nk52_evm101s485 gene=Nk52_evmTU101s485